MVPSTWRFDPFLLVYLEIIKNTIYYHSFLAYPHRFIVQLLPSKIWSFQPWDAINLCNPTSTQTKDFQVHVDHYLIDFTSSNYGTIPCKIVDVIAKNVFTLIEIGDHTPNSNFKSSSCRVYHTLWYPMLDQSESLECVKSLKFCALKDENLYFLSKILVKPLLFCSSHF